MDGASYGAPQTETGNTMGTSANITITGAGVTIGYRVFSDGHPHVLADVLRVALLDGMDRSAVDCGRGVLVRAFLADYGTMGDGRERFAIGNCDPDYSYTLDLTTGTIVATGRERFFSGTFGAYVASYHRDSRSRVW
jgi:hypothetical protein